MKRLDRALQQPNPAGKPLPKAFPELPAARRSEILMIAGQPNAGKSMIALWQSLKWSTEHNLGGLYFSADSAEIGQGTRLLSMYTGMPTEDAERLLKDRDPEALAKMAETQRLNWCFEGELSMNVISDEIDNYLTMWGTTPDYIVVDNLMDVDAGGGEDEWASAKKVTRHLNTLVRDLDTCGVVLAHVSESEKEQPCPPRKAILGKVNQKPAMIWTVADGGQQRPIAVVKDRYSKGVDKTGSTATYYEMNPRNLQFSSTYVRQGWAA